MTIHATSMSVLRTFIAGANAQYREAGLGDYQMRVRQDGSVDMPRRPTARFRGTPKAGAGPDGSAAPGPAPGQAASGAAQVTRSGAAPRPSDLKATRDGFEIAWQPVTGARRYGIWQDGVLIGHVTQPKFAGALATGAAGTIQVDAVRADGTRTELTKELRVTRASDGKVSFDVPGAPPGPAGPATAPAAAAG